MAEVSGPKYCRTPMAAVPVPVKLQNGPFRFDRHLLNQAERVGPAIIVEAIYVWRRTLAPRYFIPDPTNEDYLINAASGKRENFRAMR